MACRRATLPPFSVLRRPASTLITLPRSTPSSSIRQPLRLKRNLTSDIGDDKTGHIRAGSNEGILFLDNIFPLRLRWLLRIPFLNFESQLPQLLQRVKGPKAAAIDPMRVIQRALPKDLPISITEVIPRVKEGGSFIKFTHEPHLQTTEIEGTVRNFLKENPVQPVFNPFRRVRAFLVRGRPWLEDLQRYPTPKVKVEFLPEKAGSEAKELPQETLYAMFRRYGKIIDIQSQPADSKVLPKYATITFRLSRHAIMARNCMHGFAMPETVAGGQYAGTVVKLSYEQIIKGHWIRDWLKDHPRVVFPILVAIFATITVAIFDPIRTFFIKAHVERSFHLADNRGVQWIWSQVRGLNPFKSHKGDAGLKTIWRDRKNDIEQIQTWLMESTDTFIVVQGPRGAGKKELVVDEALKDRKTKLVIDCKPIQEARGDSSTIVAAANEVGYRPVFSWMNSISSLVDLAAQGTIGTKTGFSETLDTQLAKIWSNTTAALKAIALQDRSKNEKDKNMGDDEYLEAHPETRPVVIVDNFLHKSQENSVVYDKVAEWAANLTTANIAHVIFLTTDVSFSKSLSNALPDRVFRTISLGDVPPEVAKKYVLDHISTDVNDSQAGAVAGQGGDKRISQLDARPDLKELDGCIATLGGRLSDLEFLARRIRSGETPNRAVHEIIEQSASEILKMYLLDIDTTKRSWTATQTWHLIKMLADNDQIRYHEALLSDAFKSSEGVLRALEQAEMISIVSANGRPVSIKPGKPVYRAAFQYLTEDRVLSARMDLEVLTAAIKSAGADIDKYEQELSALGSLPKQPREIGPRVKYLLDKLMASQMKVEQMEKESGVLKKILSQEY